MLLMATCVILTCLVLVNYVSVLWDAYVIVIVMYIDNVYQGIVEALHASSRVHCPMSTDSF